MINENKMVELYNNGIPVGDIARLAHKRNIHISNILQSMGVDVPGNWRNRATITQSNSPKPKTKMSVGITNILTQEQWAYIAGIFDGEGCLQKENKKQNHRIIIAQKETELLYWLNKTVGVGTVAIRQKSSQNQYRVSAQRQVFDFLCHIQPYLIVKREKCNLAINEMKVRYEWN